MFASPIQLQRKFAKQVWVSICKILWALKIKRTFSDQHKLFLDIVRILSILKGTTEIILLIFQQTYDNAVAKCKAEGMEIVQAETVLENMCVQRLILKNGIIPIF